MNNLEQINALMSYLNFKTYPVKNASCAYYYDRETGKFWYKDLGTFVDYDTFKNSKYIQTLYTELMNHAFNRTKREILVDYLEEKVGFELPDWYKEYWQDER